MEAGAAALAAMRAKDTTLSTLARMLSPPELGDGARSDSEDDLAEAHLAPFALPHDDAAAALAAWRAAPRASLPQVAQPGMQGIPGEPPGLLTRPGAPAEGAQQRAAARAGAGAGGGGPKQHTPAAARDPSGRASGGDGQVGAAAQGVGQVSAEERERGLALVRGAVLPRPQVCACLGTHFAGLLMAMLQRLMFSLRMCTHVT